MLDILVVDDDETVREPIAFALESAGHRVTQAVDGLAALTLMETHGYDLAVCDVRMPRVDGLTLARRVRRESPDTDVVLMTTFPRIPDAVGSLKDGAVDYVTKPFDPDEFTRDVVGPIDERRALRKRFERARRDLATHEAGGELVGASRVMRELTHKVGALAASDCGVLLLGPPGTGKKLVARTLHALSSRRQGPLVVVPCAILGDLMRGDEVAARSGVRAPDSGLDATGPRDGDGRDAWLRVATGGTLVLDGVDGLDVPTQARLLQALSERDARARRGPSWEALGVRLVALASRDLAALASAGGFSGPLALRLAPVTLSVPALVQREGDLQVLCAHFLRALAPPRSANQRGVSPAAWRALEAYDFPGNVRELESILEAALALANGRAIELEHLPERLRAAAR
jgi:DNA-binding NtrC family response regulator